MARKLEIPPLFLWLCLLGLPVLWGCTNGTATTSISTKDPMEQPRPVVNTVGPGYFKDVTSGSGINHVYRNDEEARQYAILESLGGGVALIDYNRDGLLDAFFTGGGKFKMPHLPGEPCKLYRNDGDFKFTDVTKEVGLEPIDFYNHGGAVGDYDNDGWPDLLVTGYGRMALFHNKQGKFTDVTEAAGLRDQRDVHWSTSAAFGDLNGDGWPDLFVAHYVNWHPVKNHPACKDSAGKISDVCSPRQFQGLVDALYFNKGDGTFREVTKEAELQASKGLGCILADVDQDGRLDIYVANDTVDNFLYLNRCTKDEIKFVESATKLNTARDEDGIPNGSMGIDVADYDGSGNFSIFVTNYQHEPHALYQNRGPSKPFRHASASAGIRAIQLIYVGFGTGFLDYDLDGAEDIFINNGHVVHHPPPPGTLKQRPVLLRNLRQPGQQPHLVRFEEVSRAANNLAGPFFAEYRMGRGVAFGDLNNDGKTDMLLSYTNEPAVVLRGIAGEGQHWLGLSLEGKPNRDAVGAVLTLERTVSVDGKPMVEKLNRQIKGGGSYLSARDLRVVYGLGATGKFDKLTIKWPDGQAQSFTPDALTMDSYWKITQGEERPKPLLAK